MSPTSIPGFSIRPATPDDVPLVLHFIRALADYERLAHEVVATEADLHATLFGEQPAAEVVLGFYEDEPVGFALFFPTYSTFLARPGIWLEDLFVEPAWRGRGFGRALLAYLGGLAYARGCGRLEWAVLDWNEPAIRFYEALGARPQSDWTTYRVTGDALVRLAGA